MSSVPSKAQKIIIAAQKMSKSPAFEDFMKLSPDQWAHFLSQLDESAVEDCLLLLKEEAEMYHEIELKRHRRHEANKKKLLDMLTPKNGL